ncbi:MAG: NADP-dependent phosphogluconate dehydrogenase [Trueperaceae bacterium]|nr:NADP-dependent phosphogluconate dehydrogenase [Trueperaceae bacterium]
MPDAVPGPAALGLIGLGVMGRNLAHNLADHGYAVAIHDRDPDAVRSLAGARDAFHAAPDPAALLAAVEAPRTLLLMVPAGDPVDALIAALEPHLAAGDVLLDGGNSHYADTRRREAHLAERGVAWLGMGVSGGADGARHGPALMPGGDADAYARVAPILRAIAAKTDDGEPCAAHLGPDGAGHYVKMVHNGIEYADMQLLAEAYALLSDGLGFAADGLEGVLRGWRGGPLEGFLLDVTIDVLAARDPDGTPTLDDVLDAAGQKGTGRWTIQSALDLGVNASVLAAAVDARALSADVAGRARAAAVLPGPPAPDAADARSETESGADDAAAVAADLHDALHLAKAVAYAQGFALLRAASDAHGWALDLGRAAASWRAGCILRGASVEATVAAYRHDPDTPDLLLAPSFAAAADAHPALRRTVARAAGLGVAAPALSAALAHYDGRRTARGPAALIQAQRDAFGGHGFVRRSDEGGPLAHADGRGPEEA